jgi:hypothetical protein
VPSVPLLSLPLTVDVRIPTKAIAAPTRKALLSPLRKALAGTILPPLPTKTAESTAGGITVAATAAMTARLSDCPMNLIVERVPDAAPRLGLSTEPMTELVLGAENKPMPMPIMKSVPTTYESGVFTPNWLIKSRLAHIRPIPIEAKKRDPNRSESQPLIGERSAMGTGIEIRIRPAVRGE